MRFIPTVDPALAPYFCLGMAATYGAKMQIGESEIMTAFSIGKTVADARQIKEIADRLGMQLEDCTKDMVENGGLFLALDDSDFFVLLLSEANGNHITVCNPRRGRYAIERSAYRDQIRDSLWQIKSRNFGITPLISSAGPILYTIPNRSEYFKNDLSGTEISDQSTLEIRNYLQYKSNTKQLNEMDSSIRFFASYECLMRIHRQLFSEMDPRAGELRRNVASRITPFVHPNFIEMCLRDYFSMLPKPQTLTNLRRDEIVSSLSPFLSDLNLIHPFINGNGRTLKHFFRKYMQVIGMDLDFSHQTRSEEYHAFFFARTGDISALTLLIDRSLRL